MELFVVSLIAFLAAVLTFFSGFGLGTLLAPVLMLFFPVDVAIALTGIVHFFNNMFKLVLVGKNVNKTVFIRFGIPAVIFAFIGAYALLQIPAMQPLFSYELFGKIFSVYPLKLTIAVVILFFAMMDILPYFNQLQFDKNKLSLGGALSGFFGGLAGTQGALRSAFLIRAGLSKEAFVGTTVVISSLVDITRLGVYSTRMVHLNWHENAPLLICATLSAMTGAFIGNQLLKKVTITFLKFTVATFLILIGIALGFGWI